MADASFLLRALAATLGFSTLLVVDAGSPPPPRQMGSLGMALGRVFRLPETLMLQVRRTDIFSEYVIPPTIFVQALWTVRKCGTSSALHYNSRTVDNILVPLLDMHSKKV